MFNLIHLIGILTLCHQIGSEEADINYHNHSLVNVYPLDMKQLEALANFKDPMGQIVVLKPSHGLNDTMDLLVPQDRMEYFKSVMDGIGIEASIKQNNYGRSLESSHRLPKRRLMGTFSVYEYHSYGQILDYLRTVERKYPKLVTLQNLGRSYNGKIIKLVKISANPDAENPVMLFDAGIHAREWVAPVMAIYIIHRLVHDPQAVHNELYGVDWYIMPLTNPDGYEFTRSSNANRLWRKTRSRHNSVCYGVDGNRNFGYKFGVSGVSSDPCDKETYAGPRPFSEKETKMIRNVMMEFAARIKLYVSIHAYGQYLVYPWGYTGDVLPKRWKQLDSLAKAVSQAVVKAGGPPFKVLSAGKWYPAAGGSDDFAFGSVGIPYSYTMEITEGYEFTFPEHLLSKTLPPLYEGFKEFGRQIRKEFSKNLKKSISDIGPIL